MTAYDAFASAYDTLNTEIDYDAMAKHITSKLNERGIGKGALVLDLGCGTGSLTSRLAKSGFDMTAIDSSAEMLNIARENINDPSVLLLCQDITDFELYGTVAAVVSTTDTINHITDPDDLRRVFDLVRNYLDPDGIFIFDVNSPNKFENTYGTNDYVLEDEGVLLAWQNDYDSKSGMADFYITLFEETPDGKWERTDTDFSERCYTEDFLRDALNKAGFEVLSVTDSYSDIPAGKESDRLCITAKRA